MQHIMDWRPSIVAICLFCWTALDQWSCSAVGRGQQRHTRSRTIRLPDGSRLHGFEKASTETAGMVTEFLGVPYATPPLGKLRFRKPRPNAPWKEELSAGRQPHACVQTPDDYFPGFYGAEMWNSPTELSEDCLYLNIWVPGKIDTDQERKKLPVMAWIYGGGFWSGSMSLQVYDGRILAASERVIVLSMNYRVSVFGFLYLGDERAPGNVGLWDQLLALQWLRKNIDRFGGDPDTVTLFGESAGAASVSMHMLSKRSEPYFTRAIMQSGSATAPWAMESKELMFERAIHVCEALKCDNITRTDRRSWDADRAFECLMKASADQLRAQEWAPVAMFADFPWVPLVDGDFLEEEPAVALANGRFKRTEVLLGSNQDESIYFIVYTLQDVFNKTRFFKDDDFVFTETQWKKSVNVLLPTKLKKNSVVREAVFHEYVPHQQPRRPRDYLRQLDRVFGDHLFLCNVNEMAQRVAERGLDVFYYYFTHRASAQQWPSWMGVVHGYEINFIFGEPLNDTYPYSYTDEEKQLSRQFMAYWANFARTGDPNIGPDGRNNVGQTWPKYRPAENKYLNMTAAEHVLPTGHGPRSRYCAFWKRYLPELASRTEETHEVVARWKSEFGKWKEEYMVDWRQQFEAYKQQQAYQRLDDELAAAGSCHSSAAIAHDANEL